ncbi:uncharacterized membrane protein YjjB (DUF3815 family) [Microbacterium sp. AK009]|uniref:hypothetical protein n=1 Tax=Microbacterium sp. AK009 TaxID=2723068 RepID=UPI0015CDE714|nr:hypothetical protein [Microbacterium sp. AK009]NYF15981.1 uncharacterized membrane protein YjjB (DUF3815 family) [Microbacterium sp. AK009]
MSPRHLRAGRAVAAATAATVIAGTSHTLAADGPPPVTLLLVAAVLATPIALLLIGRRPSIGRTLITVTAAQAVYHLAFALVGTAGSSGAAPQGRHLHHVTLTLGEGAVATVPDAPMIGAHAVAALLTALLLHHGERMLQALGRGIRTLLAGTRPLVPSLRASIVRIGIVSTAWTVLPRTASGCSSRGPPARVAVL